jgi:hydrogenase maturation protease
VTENSGSSSTAPESCASKILLLGYGNELRGDDAVGPRVAMWVKEWTLPGLTAQALPQLTPELAAAIAQSQHVIFVDATATLSDHNPVQVTAIGPAESDDWEAHACTPQALLTLTQALYRHCPSAWLITIPARQFDFGMPLSPEAVKDLTTALKEIRKLYHYLSAKKSA